MLLFRLYAYAICRRSFELPAFRHREPHGLRKSAACPGLQIDLLIQTPKSVYVIEVKRCNRIETSIEKEIEKKVSLLGIGSGKSIRTALVYDGKLSPEVEENGFIDFLIPFNRLMEANDEP